MKNLPERIDKLRPLLLAVVVVTIICVHWYSATHAAIYVCEAKDGGQHFTNAPESENCVIFQGRSSSSAVGRHLIAPSAGKKSRPGTRGSYDAHIVQCGSRYNIDPNLIKAVIKTESGFNRYAVSKRGAQGLMQLMPATAKELNVEDPFNPHQNIDGGTRYLRTLLDIFNGDLVLTLAAYNAGPTLVKKVQRVPRIPETITYVKRVLAYYKSYRGGKAVEPREAVIRVGGMVTVQ